MKIEKLPKITIEDCYNVTDVANKLNLPINGTGHRISKQYIEYYNLDTSHFRRMHKLIKYPNITKLCPVCQKPFTVQSGSPKEKQTCSYSCSNTFNRSGINNPNYSATAKSAYRTICFHYHKKECVVCGESKIVEVHHYDKNHSNNDPKNLIPLCPTHHQYIHSRYKLEIVDIIDKYRDALPS